MKKVEDERGQPVTIIRDSKHKGLNWDILRTKVAKGMRNATLMAVAPNANIGLVVGTTPGIDARFSQVFSRNKISGKYLDLNHNLVKDLKNMGIWEKTKDLILEYQGDISEIAGIPQYIKDIYKTSFTTSPYAYIEVAARAQKWVDQALSRNMYLETRDIDETMKIYMTAWEKGLKSTYYLHMKPRHSAEQSTVKVNKAEKMGMKGFGAVAKAFVPSAEPVLSPISRESMHVVASAPVQIVAFAKVAKAEVVPEPEQISMPLESEIKLEKKIESVADIIKEIKHAPSQSSVMKESITKEHKEVVIKKGPYQPLSKDLISKVVANDGKKSAAFVCPIDPAERAQCDSCQ
jgi:ribonucleoside-diphosphate reductase alpha chain